jgi:succinoglycan biosynthesis transport protein ExoP
MLEFKEKDKRIVKDLAHDSTKEGSRYRDFSANLIAYKDPKSPAAEAFRILRTNVSITGIDRSLKTIVFTSPEPNDGKTSTACNFAIAMAQAEKSVLLVDCDLRKPRIHRYFGIHNDIGLTNALSRIDADERPLLNYTKKIPEIKNLSIITAGFIPPNPTELLSSRKFQELINQIKDFFDMVIIDTPPSAQLSDASLVGKISDGVLLVVASGETDIQAAMNAKKALVNVGAKILGVVLTKIDQKSGSYYRYYYSNKYYYEEEK